MSDDKKVDESWKEMAKAEPVSTPPPRAPKGGDSPDPRSSGAPPSGPPPADFPSLVASIATGALMAMGAEPDEEGTSPPRDLERARYAIDLLGMLAEKTKGNLAPPEERHLAAVLHQLRLAFVEASRAT